MHRPFTLRTLALLAVTALSGCSGGSSKSDDDSAASSVPQQPAPETSTPAPDPTPPPQESTWASRGVTFNTLLAQQILTSAEFRGADANCQYVGCAASGAPAIGQSQAFELHNLHTALSSGITGADTLVAVVDDGFRTTHQEFAGKTIHQHGSVPSAAHGTHVASLIGGVQDGRGMHGVAPGANLHLTAINPSGGTTLDLANVTAGTLDATARGAVAQNNSWGFNTSAADFDAHLRANPTRSVAQAMNAMIGNYGSVNWQAYLDALDGFQTSGVVVWALSNDETMTSGDVMAALPYFDQRLQGAWIAAANGYFEVDGAGDITRAIRLSAACGYAASFCIAGDGTTTAANATSDTGYSGGTGTSYVAPQIAGTVALLAQAFPDLTPEEWTKRLLASADNSWFSRLGVAVAGTSDFGNGVTHAYSGEWGHGVLDIAAALSPIGQVSYLSGDHVLTSTRTSLNDSGLTTPASYGDGLQVALQGTEVAVFDALNRSYAVEGSHLVTPEIPSILPGLLEAVSPRSRGLMHPSTMLGGPNSAADATGGTVSLANSAVGLLDTRANAVTNPGSSIFSLAGDNLAVTAVHQIGSVEITAAGFTGEGPSARLSSYGGGLNLAFGEESRFSVGVSYLGEQNGLLGLQRSASFGWGENSAISTVHLGLDHQFTSDLSVFGRFEYGGASPSGNTGGLVASLSDVQFSGFQIGARMAGVVTRGDTFSLSVSQPLRIENGTVDLRVPTGRSADGTIQQRQLSANLAPSGRELDLGLDYQVPMGAGALQLALQYRMNAGHSPGASALGAAIGFGQSF